eukprot:scaffold251527_cov30-Tisochrysis_lutea.AAC.5
MPFEEVGEIGIRVIRDGHNLARIDGVARYEAHTTILHSCALAASARASSTLAALEVELEGSVGTKRIVRCQVGDWTKHASTALLRPFAWPPRLFRHINDAATTT